MSVQANRASYAHAGVRISALVPDTWAASEVSDDHVRFFAPAHPDHDEHQSTFSIRLGQPDGFGPEEFPDFCDASLARLQRELLEFELRTVERFTLSSFVDIHAIWYDCRTASGIAVAQLQAFGLMGRYSLYLINAATIRSLSDVYLPLFDDVLRSLRMLPSRPV